MNDSDKEEGGLTELELELELEELKAKNFLKKCGYKLFTEGGWKEFQNKVWLYVAGLCITAFIMGFLSCKLIGG